MCCFGWSLIINLVSFVASLVILSQTRDPMYRVWFRRVFCCKHLLAFIIHLISFASFKVHHLMYAKLVCLDIRLEHINRLRYLSIASGCYLLTVIGFVIAGAKFAFDEEENRLFWIDFLVFQLICVLVSLLALRRN